ncbi:MAG: hypothetical protein ABJH52_06145 [Henriciella sp.]
MLGQKLLALPEKHSRIVLSGKVFQSHIKNNKNSDLALFSVVAFVRRSIGSRKNTHSVWNYRHSAIYKSTASVGITLLKGGYMPYAITSPELGEVLLRESNKFRKSSSGENDEREPFNQRRGVGLVTEDPDAFPPFTGAAISGRT